MVEKDSSECKHEYCCVNPYELPPPSSAHWAHLLAWVNDCLSADYNSIEDLADGVAYAHLMDMLFPNIVPLEEVHAKPNLQHDYIHNLQLVRKAFEEVGVHREIPIDRLIKAEFQDNFEFLHWFKGFFDANYTGHRHNASETSDNTPKSQSGDVAGLTSNQESISGSDEYSVNKATDTQLVLFRHPSKYQKGETRLEDEYDELRQKYTSSLIDQAWSRRVQLLVANKAKLMESFSWLSTVGGGFSSLGERDSKFSARAGALSLGQQLHLAELLGDERLKVMCHLFAALAALQLDNKRLTLNYISRVIVPLINAMPYRDPILTNILHHICFRISVFDRFVGTRRNAIEDVDEKNIQHQDTS